MPHDLGETRWLDPDEIPNPPKPGDVLRDRYRLNSELGRGGMGVVFHATDLQLERDVAIKVLPEARFEPEAKEHLLAEARAAAALNHPHIVSVHDVGEDRGVPFFVMELIEGTSLAEERPRDPVAVIEIALRICDALDHAHSQGIVHRDLKPENVLIAGADPRGLKLADLGLALHTEGGRLTQAGAVAGTVAYMAPEQALGSGVDGRADLYALGVVLYELTTGRLPFTGDAPLSIVSQHVHAPVVPPRALRSEISPALETVILKLLAKDPEDRFADAKETAQSLERAREAPTESMTGDSAGAVAILDALARGRLVGRDSELNDVRELWYRAIGGNGHFVLLSGEPGAGKTRLAREILVQATLDGAAVLSGACYEFEAATPYLPFVEAFRRWVRTTVDDDALAGQLGSGAPLLAKLAPELVERLGPFPERTVLPAHEERLLFFDAVADALRRAARNRGLIFYIDDLHWADTATLGLLGHLLRSLREERILFIASYRETELDRTHSLAKALVDWNRERLTTRISLRRFDVDGTRAQLAALLGESVQSEFAGVVHNETEGNPFFVEEVLKALIEEGSIRREHGRWERCEIPQLVIPQSMKAAIGNRLDRVSAETNEVLRAAAILGKTFAFEELTTVARDKSEDLLLDALDEGVSAQLILAERDESFSFTHDKIREVLYEELNPIRRRRLHLRTAEGLEELGKAARVETLAYHFVEAGEYERGLDYAKRAAAEAESVFAYGEAIAAYQRALECADALELTQEKSTVEEAMGNASMASGEMIGAGKHFERALTLAEGDQRRAHLQVRAASSYVATGDPKGLEYVRAAIAVLDPESDPFGVANALAIEARFNHLGGHHRKAIELLKQALVLTEPAVDRELTTHEAWTIAEITSYLAGANQHLGLFDDADAWSRRTLEFGVERGMPLAQALGYEFLGENGISKGEWASAIEYANTEREIAERMHSRERFCWTHYVVGHCSLLMGEVELAEKEILDGIALAEAIGERRLASGLRSMLSCILAERGDLDGAVETGLAALETAEALGLFFSRADARRCLAYAYHKRGNHDEAIRLMDEVLELNADKESRVSRLWMGPTHVEALLAAGRREEATARLTEYAAMVAECQTPFFAREVERLGELVSGALDV